MAENIAIYLNNTDRSAFSERFENDGIKIISLLSELRPHWNYQIFDCVMGEFYDSPTLFDGIILTGSVASVNQNTPWIEKLLDQIRLIVSAKTPLIGICFGHQAIAKALGGRVGKSDNWEFGVSKTIIHAQRNWMDPPIRELDLYSANSEVVLDLPPAMEVLGGNSACPISLAALEDHVMSTQYHPEMSDEFILALIDEYSGTLGEDLARQARNRIKSEAQGKVFAQWMINFLEKKCSA